MLPVFFFVIVLVAAFVTFFILYYYGKWNKSLIFVFIVAYLSWILSILANFLIPIDITSTLIRICNSTGSDPSINKEDCLLKNLVSFQVLNITWRIVYWSSNALSWLVIPILQCYLRSGHFTFCGRLRYSIVTNLIWYGSYLVIFGCFLIYLGVNAEITWINIKTAIAAASNTWSLILLVLLMGYGLVDVPKSLWRRSNLVNFLNLNYFQIAKLHEEIVDNHEKLNEISEKINEAHKQIQGNIKFQKYLEIIINKLPEERRTKIGDAEQVIRQTRDTCYRDSSDWKFDKEASFVKLHIEVKQTIDFVIRLENVLKMKIIQTKKLEDIKLFKDRGTITSSFRHKNPILRYLYKLYLYIYIYLSSLILKISSIILILVSLIFIWNESTFFSYHPNLSIFSIMVEDYQTIGIMYMQIIAFICLAYMALCTHQTVFKLRFFSFLYFARNHQTSPYTFLFTAGLVSRLSNAICLNYLAMLHLDRSTSVSLPLGLNSNSTNVETIQTSFTYIMGRLELLSFISDGFNVYYPMFILVVCLSTFFSIGSRILHMFGIEQFTVKSEESDDLIREGFNIYQRELRNLETNEVNQQVRNVTDDFSIVGRQNPQKYTRLDDSQNLINSTQRIDDFNESYNNNFLDSNYYKNFKVK